tara:strand:+ start:4564 stop:4902 length:339 start_codon:yes stop_codon:yes gene_type:complete
MDFKTRLTRYYSLNAPQKLCDVDKLVQKYSSKEKELFRQLTFKWGPEAKLSDAERKAIQSRTAKAPIVKAPKQTIDINEWMDSLLDQNDKNLLREIENYSGNQIPQSILDRI